MEIALAAVFVVSIVCLAFAICTPLAKLIEITINHWRKP